MASTFTGLKLQGQIGRFGKTSATDVEGYVEFPDGKVCATSSPCTALRFQEVLHLVNWDSILLLSVLMNRIIFTMHVHE